MKTETAEKTYVCMRCRQDVQGNDRGHVCAHGHSIAIYPPGCPVPNLAPKLTFTNLFQTATRSQSL